MASAPAGAMVDLLTAGDARDRDLRRNGRGLDGGKEREGAHAARNVVMLGFESERAGHATAAGVDEGGIESGQLEGAERGVRTGEGLLVAVRMEQERAPRGKKTIGEGGLFVDKTDEKLIEEERVLGNDPGLGPGNQVGVLVAQSKETGRLDADDGDAGGGEGPQRFDVAAGPLAGRAEHAFGDGGAAAANETVDEADAVAERLQDRYGGMSDLRVKVIGEGVVEEHDLTTRGGRAEG